MTALTIIREPSDVTPFGSKMVAIAEDSASEYFLRNAYKISGFIFGYISGNKTISSRGECGHLMNPLIAFDRRGSVKSFSS